MANHKVIPFLHILKGEHLDYRFLAAYADGLKHVQAWYFYQLGRTFTYDPVRVVAGTKTLDDLTTGVPQGHTHDGWGPVMASVSEADGFQFWQHGEIALVLTVGLPISAWTGGAVGCGGDCGVVSKDHAVLENLAGILPPEARYNTMMDWPGPGRGVIAHELLHAFGQMAHEEGDGSYLGGTGLYRFPDVGLHPNDRPILEGSPFLRLAALPGRSDEVRQLQAENARLKDKLQRIRAVLDE